MTHVYLRTHATAISDIEEDIQHLADQLRIEGITTDNIRQFAIRRITYLLASTCFQMYIIKVSQADQLFLRAVLPLKESQKY